MLGWRMCSQALGEVPIPRQGLVEKQGHDAVGVVAGQQAHAPHYLLLRAGLQLGVELFQNPFHDFFDLQGGATGVSVSLPASSLSPNSQTQGRPCNPTSDTLLKVEF